MLYQLNLRELTYALSEALDYVGIDDILHGKRVAYIACEIGKQLGWRQSKLDKVMLMAMLHDCGVSSTDVHHAIVSQLDWEDSYVHCAKGASLLEEVPQYSDFVDVIAFHHTHWEAFSSHIDEEIKLYANLIYLSDRIDALRSQFGAHLHHEKETIRAIIQQHTPSMFSPQLYDAFKEASQMEFFWYYLESSALPYYFKDWVDQGDIQAVPFDSLKKIALMFAGIVDAKESIHKERTLHVASLARYIAHFAGLSLRDQESIELSALLHDLGKLRIPDDIATKTAPLNDVESSHLRRQGFDAQIILGQIKGFETIKKIVAMHYTPSHTKAYSRLSAHTSMPLDVFILTIATTFERGQREEASALLAQMVETYQLEKSLEAKVEAYCSISL
ncbi:MULTISPECIES: HD domain-containing protein [unclassified Sulfurospirillum]|nr:MULTISPECIES: HD domain-containing protein [unclassified Sulfurospirillum]